jgi:Putative MetA-pathway of phenol degradation
MVANRGSALSGSILLGQEHAGHSAATELALQHVLRAKRRLQPLLEVGVHPLRLPTFPGGGEPIPGAERPANAPGTPSSSAAGLLERDSGGVKAGFILVGTSGHSAFRLPPLTPDFPSAPVSGDPECEPSNSAVRDPMITVRRTIILGNDGSSPTRGSPASRRPRSVMLLHFILLALCPASLTAQSMDDGLLMPTRALRTGFLYAHDSWDQYWEGSLKRDNGNIGTLTTQSVTWVGHYGLTDRLSVIAMLPYVWTHASQGPLHGMRGLQDLTLAAKYRLLSTAFTDQGALGAMVVGAIGIPASDYTPDFLPLSIGLASRSFSGRFTLDFQANAGWFLTGSAAYTWRDKVALDRPAYYTNGQLYLSEEVAMPAVVNYTVNAGYRKGRLHVPMSVIQQRTLGGGDIRRQDMPFVSNRMNFVKVDGFVMYDLAMPKDLSIRLGATRTVSGRNVGQATTLTGGLLYTFHF